MPFSLLTVGLELDSLGQADFDWVWGGLRLICSIHVFGSGFRVALGGIE